MCWVIFHLFLRRLWPAWPALWASLHQRPQLSNLHNTTWSRPLLSASTMNRLPLSCVTARKVVCVFGVSHLTLTIYHAARIYYHGHADSPIMTPHLYNMGKM
jgi:hypothetical protein